MNEQDRPGHEPGFVPSGLAEVLERQAAYACARQPAPHQNIVFLSGAAQPLALEAADRRFMVVSLHVDKAPQQQEFAAWVGRRLSQLSWPLERQVAYRSLRRAQAASRWQRMKGSCRRLLRCLSSSGQR